MTYFSSKNSRGFIPTPTLVPFRFSKIFSVATTLLSQKVISGGNDSETKKPHKGWCRGFTLVEMVVSVAIFSIVLFVAMSAFLSIVSGDHKSRAMRIATDNLNLALEDMSRKIKTGGTYSCGGVAGANDCPAGTSSNTFAFTNQDGISRTIYKLGTGPGVIVNGPGASGCGDVVFSATQGCILREDATGISMLATSPEIDIKSLKFYVFGSAPYGTTGTDKIQPTVVIAIEGSLGADAALFAGNAGFKIQTMITQRAYDN